MRQPLGLLQACWKSSTAHRTVLLIGAPRGSCEVSSYNALNWQHLETLDHHAPALELGDHFSGQAFLESLRDSQGDVVSAKRWYLRLQQLEPELAKLSENGPLLVDTLVVPN